MAAEALLVHVLDRSLRGRRVAAGETERSDQEGEEPEGRGGEEGGAAHRGVR